MFEKPTLAKIKSIATKFEVLHGIFYVFKTIDGNHIPIFTPPNDLAFYYYRKWFYFALLQGVVDAKCKF